MVRVLKRGGGGGYPLPLRVTWDFGLITWKIFLFYKRNPPARHFTSQLKRTKKWQEAQSRRLQGLVTEIETTRFTCVCLVEGETVDSGVIQTSCCRQFLHQSCYLRWCQTPHARCFDITTNIPLCQHPCKQSYV